MGAAFDLESGTWATLRGLLDEALALEPAQRGAWLDQLDARGHAALAPRLRRLLSHADTGTAARLLETLPKVETGQFAPPFRCRRG